MAIKLSKLAAAVSLACVLPMASADVLNFDDLTGLGFFTSTYKGFNFGNNDPGTNPWFYTQQVSPFYTPHSGSTYVSTDFGLYNNANAQQATMAITSATAFTFQGAYFSGADPIQYVLTNGANVVFTGTASGVNTFSAGLTNVSTFIGSGYTGLVTGVNIVTRQGYFGMDDFTYNTAATVPEPATYAMLAVGLAGLGFVARRRKQG